MAAKVKRALKKLKELSSHNRFFENPDAEQLRIEGFDNYMRAEVI